MNVRIGMLAAVILASWIALFRSCESGAGRQVEKLIHGLGPVMAKTVVSALEPGARAVVIRYPPLPDEAENEQRERFIRTLERSGVIIQAVEVLPIPPDSDPDFPRPEQHGVSFDDFMRIRNAHPEADVIISIAGAVMLRPTEVERIPPGPPNLVVLYVHGEQPFLDDLRERGVLSMAIVSRKAPPRDAGTPDSPEQWLASYFDVVRAEK